MASPRPATRHQRIPVQQIREALDGDWPPEIYLREVLSRRTRVFVFNYEHKPKKVEIVQTLLGVELKFGSRRINVPDLATARYLAFFAKLGVQKIMVPYDITRIARIADRLEGAWQRALWIADQACRPPSSDATPLLWRRLHRAMRLELSDPKTRSNDTRKTVRRRPSP